jgi:hypothetical protein
MHERGARDQQSAKVAQIGSKSFYCQGCDWPYARHCLGSPRPFGFFGGTLHLHIQRRNLNIETFDLLEVHLGEFSDAFWQAYGLVRNRVGQAFDMDRSLLCNDAMVCKMASQCVHRLGALADEHLSSTKQHGTRLLSLGLQCNERIVGREAASTMASASATSFFCLFTNGFT